MRMHGDSTRTKLTITITGVKNPIMVHEVLFYMPLPIPAGVCTVLNGVDIPGIALHTIAAADPALIEYKILVFCLVKLQCFI